MENPFLLAQHFHIFSAQFEDIILGVCVKLTPFCVGFSVRNVRTKVVCICNGFGSKEFNLKIKTLNNKACGQCEHRQLFYTKQLKISKT